MERLSIGSSGLLLASHLAAYGLASVLDAQGERAFVGHDLKSAEVEPFVLTPAALGRVLECVRCSADVCSDVVNADVNPGQPVLYPRFTKLDRGPDVLAARESLLEGLDPKGGRLALHLAAGLGAPVTWGPSRTKPSEGATWLDGVPGNSTSDLVRGLLRRTLPAADALTLQEATALWSGQLRALGDEHRDHTYWAPPEARIHLAHQWLAALGLGVLPVGLRKNGGRTPCCHRGGNGEPRVRLPLFAAPVSLPRLRAVLALAEFSLAQLRWVDRARLRALGVEGVVEMGTLGSSQNRKMLEFRFGRGEIVGL